MDWNLHSSYVRTYSCALPFAIFKCDFQALQFAIFNCDFQALPFAIFKCDFQLRSLPLVVVMFYSDYTKQRILFHYFSGSKASIGFKAVSKYLLRICSFTVCFWCFEAVEDNSACQENFKSLMSGHLIHCNRKITRNKRYFTS